MPNSDVIVRMYNVGFGDAFLVLIPADGGIRKVLFDCGSIKAGEKPLKDIRDRIIVDVTDSDGVPRLDVVVGTHRHKDHVSGFDSAVWRQVEVKEVWMPWTEDPRDDEAKRIRETQSRLAASLVSSFAAKVTSAATPSATDQRYYELALNALSNDGAMRTLHEGFAGRPSRRFFPSKTAEENTFETTTLPGVKIFVMGPSRNKEVIRDMDPPSGKSYLRLLGSAQSGSVVVPDPFNGLLRQNPRECCSGAYLPAAVGQSRTRPSGWQQQIPGTVPRLPCRPRMAPRRKS